VAITKNRIRVALLALLSVLSVGAISSTLGSKATPAAQPPPAKRTVKLAPEFERLYADFSAGFAARDLKLIMSVFDKNVVLSYQDTPDTNYEEIKAGFEYDFKNDPPGTTWRGLPEESHQDGNLAIVVAHWEYRELVKGKAVLKHRIRSVDVLKRTDGRWKIVRTINYPEA